jgi:hypothetical protein
MNYDHFVIQRLDGTSVIDYSPPRQPNGLRGTAPLDDLAENNLDESKVSIPPIRRACSPTPTARAEAPVARRRAVDWSGDGDTTDSVTVNIDTSDAMTQLPPAARTARSSRS